MNSGLEHMECLLRKTNSDW